MLRSESAHTASDSYVRPGVPRGEVRSDAQRPSAKSRRLRDEPVAEIVPNTQPTSFTTRLRMPLHRRMFGFMSRRRTDYSCPPCFDR
jgi:hypothetical protein